MGVNTSRTITSLRAQYLRFCCVARIPHEAESRCRHGSYAISSKEMLPYAVWLGLLDAEEPGHGPTLWLQLYIRLYALWISWRPLHVFISIFLLDGHHHLLAATF